MKVIIAMYLMLILQPACSTEYGNVLFKGQRIQPGSYMQSSSKRYTLYVEYLCNLSLYDNIETTNPIILWSAFTPKLYTYNDCVLTMEENGNLALIRSSTNSYEMWSSNTSGANYLILQDDGHAVIYKYMGPTFADRVRVWSST